MKRLVLCDRCQRKGECVRLPGSPRFMMCAKCAALPGVLELYTLGAKAAFEKKWREPEQLDLPL